MSINGDTYKFIYFKDFVSFLLQNHLEEVIDQYILVAEEVKPEWDRRFKEKESLRVAITKMMVDFFGSVLDDHALEYSREMVNNWKTDNLQNFDRDVEDCIKTISIKRISTFHFVSKYTSDLELIKKIYNELEYFYGKITLYTVNIFMKFYEESVDLGNREIKLSKEKLQLSNEELKENQEELQTINEELREHQEELQALNEELRDQINQRLIIEDALRVNEKKYRAISENLEEAQSITHVGSWEFDLKANQVYWSAELYRIFGYDPYEVFIDYERYLEHIHPDYLEYMKSIIQNSIDTLQPYNSKCKIITRNGEERWILSKGKVVTDNESQPIFLKGIALDITESTNYEIEIITKNIDLNRFLEELKSAEKSLVNLNNKLEDKVLERTKELLANEQRLKVTLESIPAIAWTANDQGEIDYFNQEYYNYSGKTFEDSKGWGWTENIHDEDLEKFKEQWYESLTSGKDFTIEFRLRNGSEKEFKWQICRAVPLRDASNKIIKWFGTCTDINEQINTSNQLMDTNTELIKVNEFLDTFVYIAAHDLRSPLSNLRMILELLNKTNSQEKKQELLNALNTSVNKLDQTVNGLVKIIEIQSTDASVVRYLRFDDVLGIVMEDLHHSFEEREIKFTTDFSRVEGIQFIEAYLISIIKNIVGNAIKYCSPNRPLAIIITSEVEGEFVLLKITDNGVGMDIAKYGKNIFKPFTRFSKIADGKGLGLYLVKNMTEKNGGKIKVESTIDVGTSFLIYLKSYKN